MTKKGKAKTGRKRTKKDEKRNWPTHEHKRMKRRCRESKKRARELMCVYFFPRSIFSVCTLTCALHTLFVCFPLHTQYSFDAVLLLRCVCTQMYRWVFFDANTNTMCTGEATPFDWIGLVGDCKSWKKVQINYNVIRTKSIRTISRETEWRSCEKW